MSPGAGLCYGAAMAPRARDYLERILTSRVYDVAVETPLEQAPALSLRAGNEILLKREDMQPVFSFKLRGAYNKMSALPKAALKRGVIAASAGNHAQGVALSAQRLGCRAQIVMPVTTPRIKVDAVAARGAEVLLVGDSYDEAYLHAKELERRRNLTFVHPYDDPDVIAGQGTMGRETFHLARKYVDEMICVDTDATCAAIKDAFEDTRSILEPAGALPVAGAKAYAERTGIKDQVLIAVACGANMNFNRLRFVAERAEVGERREAILAVTIPERPGALLRFLSRMRTDWNISLFHYRNHGADYGRVLVGMQVPRAEMAEFRRFLETVGYPWIDESQNPAYRLFLG